VAARPWFIDGNIMSFNLADSLHQHSLTRPDAPAVHCDGLTVSYGQAAQLAARLAACLVQSPTWQRADGRVPRVGVLGSRSMAACIAALGAAWAGATYVPLGSRLPSERLIGLLTQCDLAALVTDGQGAQVLTDQVLAACPPRVCVPDVAALPMATTRTSQLIGIDALSDGPVAAPIALGGGDSAYIIFTSGSTGTPKGVVISSRSIAHFVPTICELLAMRADDRVLDTCELNFDASVQNMFATWHAGACLHVLPSNQVMNAARHVREARVTVWSSVPTLAGMLRQIKALTATSLAPLRLTVFGGEPLPASLVAAWREAAPASRIVNLYGPTETTICCLAQDVGQPCPLTPGRDHVPIGRPLAGCTAAILDISDNRSIMADGVVGELAVTGVQLADGYLDAPGPTAARFVDIDGTRWYRTGDLAMRDDGGTYHSLGRVDNQVKVRGHRIELEEIDAQLRSAAGVDLASVVAWPELDGNFLGLVAFVGADRVDSTRVIATLGRRLPAYMVPSHVEALPQMPLNPSGKVDRLALRQRLACSLAVH
jgi:amino acid adenylation domain-containing protein